MADVWETIEQDETGLPIQIAVDPDDVPVFLSRKVWDTHVLSRHSIMINFKDLILVAITSPSQRVFQDEARKFVRTYIDIPAERQPSRKSVFRIRVVIKYVQPMERNYERTGLVSSVYLVRRGRE